MQSMRHQFQSKQKVVSCLASRSSALAASNRSEHTETAHVARAHIHSHLRVEKLLFPPLFNFKFRELNWVFATAK